MTCAGAQRIKGKIREILRKAPPNVKLAANQRTSDPTNFGITPRNGRRCTGTPAFHYIAGQSEAEDASKNRDRGAQPRPPNGVAVFAASSGLALAGYGVESHRSGEAPAAPGEGGG